MSLWPTPTVPEPSGTVLARWLGESGDDEEGHSCDEECCPHYADHQNGNCSEYYECTHQDGYGGCNGDCVCSHADCCSECHTHDEDCCDHECDEDCCGHDPTRCDCECEGGPSGTVTATDGCTTATDGCTTMVNGVCSHGHRSWLMHFGISAR